MPEEESVNKPKREWGPARPYYTDGYLGEPKVVPDPPIGPEDPWWKKLWKEPTDRLGPALILKALPAFVSGVALEKIFDLTGHLGGLLEKVQALLPF